MLILLRKLRNQMLQKNKITTYLLYAIGEIILVAVGIIIAIQLNEWNESKKNKDKIITSVQFLINELREDSVTVQNILERHAEIRKHSESVYNRVTDSTATIDTVIQVIKNDFIGYWDYHYTNNSTAYANMVSSGVFELMTDSMKISVKSTYNMFETNRVLVEKLSDQYREPLTDFNKRYVTGKSIIESNNNLIDQTVWNNVDPTHIWPRARWLTFTHYWLWRWYFVCLEDEEKEINNLLQELNSYQKQLIYY